VSAPEAYVSVSEVQACAYQPNAEALTLFDSLRLRASRIFDIFAGVRPGYFTETSTAASAKVVYGTGLPFLALPRFFGPAPTVAMPDGYTVPTFVEVAGSLIITDDKGILQKLGGRNLYPIVWPESVPVTVTAKWGFEAVPEDVKEAVIELTIAVWRSKDTAFLRAINSQNMTVLAQAIPDRVKQIATSYVTSVPGGFV
jgi:hypothetical protein